MRHPISNLLSLIFPFVALGVILFVLVMGFVVVSYLLFWGAVIGLIIFSIAYVRSKWFPPKVKRINPHEPQRKKGRTYDQD